MSPSPKTTAPDNTSRRDFIKRSTATMVGGTLAAQIARSAYAAGSDELRIALIGCGGRGSGAASQALSTSGAVKLVAMADAFRDRLDGSLNALTKQEHLAPRIDVKEDSKYVGFDAYQKIMARDDVHVVVVATPPGFRPIHFEAAVKANKNIFMEKPVSTDAPGIRRVLAAADEAKKKNLKVGVGLQRHHQRPYIETVSRIQDGAIGDPVAFRVYWNGAGVWVRPRQAGQTEMEYQMRNWYYFNWLCGDHINEQHIHNLDVANWVMNSHPVEAQGQGGREVRKGKDNGQIFDHHYVEYTYANGAKMYSQCRHIAGCWRQVAEFVEATKGKSGISGWTETYDGQRWKASGGGKNPYQQEHDDLFEAIRKDTPYMEAYYGATSTMTAIMGRMATYSGKVIKWDDALAKGKNIMPKKYAFDADPPVMPDADGNYPVPVPGQYDPYA